VGSLCRARRSARIDFETFRIRAFLVAAFVGCCGDFAQAAAPQWADECAAMDDDAARLACYDSHNPPHKSAVRTQGPAASTKAPEAASHAPTSATNARERPAPEARAPEPAELTARVDAVSKKVTGELLLKLDNGQSWVQAQRKAGVLIKPGERVTIAPGTFGGYLLSSDSGATMRVRRLE
jgi:hypothetical protein